MWWFCCQNDTPVVFVSENSRMICFFFIFFQVLKIRESGKFPGNSREKPRNFLDLEAHPKSNKKLIIILKVRPKSRKFPGFPGKNLGIPGG